MDIQIAFPGGKQVTAQVGDFVIRTDQPAELGGANSAPAPFDLFLASIGTCAGLYALGFCQARGIPTEGLMLLQSNDMDPTTHLLRSVRLDLHLPDGFPEKYRTAILRAVEGCKVKKTIAGAPSFEVAIEAHDDRARAARHEEVARCAGV